MEEIWNETEGGIGDCEGESETVCDGEELFGDGGERLESAVVAAVEEFEDAFP